MPKSSIPSLEDQFSYLLLLYFGRDVDLLSCCIDRAYRDFNRTLHKFGKVDNGKRIRAEASQTVKLFLTGLADSSNPCRDQASFDDRHEKACGKLCSTYSPAEFTMFHGQAQKWLNMALKYAFVFGEKHIPGYTNVFRFAHIPLDNIILKWLYDKGLEPLTCPWSRIGYEEYMSVQYWVRSEYAGESPLAVEFDLFMKPV